MTAPFGKIVLMLNLLVLVSAAVAFAEVTDSGTAGFTVQHTAEIPADPVQVYLALTDQIDQWWHPDHTFSGDAANLYIDDVPGGMFGERFPDGKGVRHLTVVFADPGKMLRLRGGLGPLQGMAVSGAMTWQLDPTAEGTRLTLTYTVGGYDPGGLDKLADPVDGVLGQQVSRLVAHIRR